MSGGATLGYPAPGKMRVDGDLTFYNVPAILRASFDAFVTNDPLEVDLSGVTRSDSAGIALVLEWTRMARGQDKSLCFVQVPAQMRSLAQVGGVDGLLSW